MRPIRWLRWLALLCPLSLATDSAAVQLPSHTETASFEATAAAPTEPYLQIELLPPVRERIRGNAAVYYGKVKSEQNNFFGNQELMAKFYEWVNKPLEELRNEPRPLLPAGSSIYGFLRQGASCDSCDWQLPIREGEYFYILLPEVQESRLFANMLAALARWQIAHGDYDGALETLQTGYALGRHVATGPTFINALVATAITNTMHLQVLTLIQQPDAPNLYWSLTALPRPLIDVRPGIEGEFDAIQLSYGELFELEGPEYSSDWWTAKFAQLVVEMKQLDASVIGGSGASAAVLNDPVAMAVAHYPTAKEKLLAEGLDAARVEAMPVGQAIVLASWYQFREDRDRAMRELFLSHTEARSFRVHRQEVDLLSIPPFRRLMVMPVDTVRNAMIRQERSVALLRTYEAIRAHAAVNDGKLPQSLDQITVVPVPIDPQTDEPFRYELVDGIGQIVDDSQSTYRIDVRVSLRGE